MNYFHLMSSYVRLSGVIKMSERAEHEIQHGEYLAGEDTELIWGWRTPAGRVRAKRRA